MAIMEGRLDLRVGQAFEHETGHAQVHPGLTGSRQKLIVLTHAPIAPNPGDGPLDHPPARQDLETRRSGWRLLVLFHPTSSPAKPLHYLQSPAERLPYPVLQRTPVSAISPNQFQARQRLLEGKQKPPGALAVLEISGVNDHLEEQPQGVNEQVALACRERLGSIVAVRRAAPGGSDRLASDDRRTGRGLPPDLLPQPFAPRGVNPLPGAVQTPFAEIGRDGGPGAVITRGAFATGSRCAADGRYRSR